MARNFDGIFNELRVSLGIKSKSPNAHAIEMREWSKGHREHLIEYWNEWCSNHPNYRRDRYTFTGGKRVLTLDKRPHPGTCELCGRSLKLGYHHWDDNNISKGLWLCYPCHMFAEIADNGLENKYLEYLGIKTGVEEEFVKMDLGE